LFVQRSIAAVLFCCWQMHAPGRAHAFASNTRERHIKFVCVHYTLDRCDLLIDRTYAVIHCGEAEPPQTPPARRSCDRRPSAESPCYDMDGSGRKGLTTVSITRRAPACVRPAATASRVSGVTSASMTPPQPAPESLAPGAPAA